MSAAMLAVYDATNITLKPPQTLIKNLFGHDFGALNATKWPHNRPHMTHSAAWKREKYSLEKWQNKKRKKKNENRKKNLVSHINSTSSSHIVKCD